MLNFFARPDPIFVKLVTYALDIMHDDVLYIDDEEMKNNKSHTHKYLSSEMIKNPAVLQHQIKLLQDYHLDEDFRYTISEYHWLILHEALHYYIHYRNNWSRNTRLHFDDLGVGIIDVDKLRDAYFWDEDYLDIPAFLKVMGSDELLRIENSNALEMVGISRKSYEELRCMAQGIMPVGGHIKVRLEKLNTNINWKESDVILPLKVGLRYPRVKGDS
jgi:hypothetical protein